VCRSERTLDGHLHRVTYTRCCIDKIDSADDEHGVASPDDEHGVAQTSRQLK
jgi:hypothetical protein